MAFLTFNNRATGDLLPIRQVNDKISGYRFQVKGAGY